MGGFKKGGAESHFSVPQRLLQASGPKTSQTMTTIRRVSSLPDADWARMMVQFLACKDPAKFKFGITSTKGVRHNVVYLEGRFVRVEGGSAIEVLPLSALVERERRGVECRYLGKDPQLPSEMVLNNRFYEKLVDNLTGNHRPRRHFIRVRCVAGQICKA